MELNHKELAVLLERCWQVKQPLNISGTVGIGKSMAAKKFFVVKAREVGREFIEWAKADAQKKADIEANIGKYLVFVDDRVSLKDNTDNKGIPKLDGEYLKWIKTLIMNLSAKKDSMVIWFKDELNKSCPSVQSAEYSIILDRYLDDLAFAENTYIFAAGNQQEDMCDVFEMSMALKNRFAHCTLKCPTSEEWTEWAMQNDIQPKIVTFLNFKPSFLFKMPKAMDKSMAFPTPRSWQKCSEMVKGVEDIDKLEMFAAANIGDGVAAEFAAWVKLNRAVDLNKILDNPELMDDFRNQIDMTTSIIAGIVEKYMSDREKVFDKAVALSFHLKDELAVYMLRLMKSVNDVYFMTKMATNVHFPTFMEKYKKYLV
jgi:hypothetical protein